MLTNRIELPSSHWLKRSNGDALPLSYVSIIQKCLHPLIVFKFCYLLHLCIKSRLGQKRLCNYERGAFISYHSLVCRDKSREVDSNHTFATRGWLCAHLGSQQQCDPLTLQLRILGTAPTSIGPLQDTWHLICIST